MKIYAAEPTAHGFTLYLHHPHQLPPHKITQEALALLKNPTTWEHLPPETRERSKSGLLPQKRVKTPATVKLNGDNTTSSAVTFLFNHPH